jgi:hypothetical protein
LTVERVVGTTVDERAAHLAGAFRDDADAVDTLARGADVTACSTVVGVRQEICSTAARSR